MNAPSEQPDAAGASSGYAGQHPSQRCQGRAYRPPHATPGGGAARNNGAGQRSGTRAHPADIPASTWRVVMSVRVLDRIWTGV